MLKRLRVKFICINMAIVTVMLCVIFGLVLFFTQANLQEDSIHMMQTIASSPIQLGRPSNQGEEVRLPYFTLETDPQGEMLTAGGGYYDLSDEDFLRDLAKTAVSSGQQTGVIQEYNLRFYRVVSHSGQYLVFADISSEVNAMKALVRNCLAIGVLSFLAFLGISILLARWAVKPVDRAWAQQRQFIADASHELKTPLTVIMANAELIQNPDCPPASRARFSASILTMSRQMRKLVESLLELARADQDAEHMLLDKVDWSELIENALLPFEPIFFEKGLTLTGQIEPGILVRGSGSHLQQVTEILLDNAQKYSAPQGEVLVTLKRQNRHCLLTVANPGEAISPEDLKNIFKRFYRVDRARSSRGSYGLGLPIAEGIVHSHKGKLWAESAGGINTFFVQLPCL